MSDTELRAKTWRRTSPLAAIFFLGKIYQAIAKNAVQSFAPLAAFVVAYEGDLKTRLALGITGFVVVTAIIAFLRYWFFRYRIQDASILIRDGVVKKTQLDIKFDRVQAVNTEQNFVFAWFDVITLRFDTAGSAGQEGYLPAVKVALAEDLQQRLSGRKAQTVDEDSDTTDAQPVAKTILRYLPLDIVKVGLTSNRALIFLALLAPLIEPTIESLAARVKRRDVEDAAVDALQIGPFEGFALLVAVAVAIALVLIGLSIAGAFLRYHRFELQSDDLRLRSSGGLLTRHEHSIRFAKVQAIHVSQNLMHRLFARSRWRAKQAASGRQDTAKKHFVIPIVDRSQSLSLVRRVLGQEFIDANLDPASEHFQRLSARYIRSRTLMIGVLPSTAATVVLSPLFGPYALLALLWIVPGFLCAWAALSLPRAAAFAGWLGVSLRICRLPNRCAPISEGAARQCHAVAVSTAQRPREHASLSRLRKRENSVPADRGCVVATRLHSLQGRSQRQSVALGVIARRSQ